MRYKNRNKFSYYLEEFSTPLKRIKYRRISEIPSWISSCSLVLNTRMVGNHSRHHGADRDYLHSDHMDCHNPDHNLHDDNHGRTEISKKIYEIL